MQEVVLLSLTAALNPSLLAATTVMLLLPKPRRLMLGYWLGAMLTSVTLGLVIVFELANSSFEKTATGTVSPAIDLTIAGLLLLIALVLASVATSLSSSAAPTAGATRSRRNGDSGYSRAPPEPPSW